MATPTDGRSTIEYLLGRGRLERIDGKTAGEALLICQGLRATGGEGSHMTVEDAISAQYAKQIPGLAKPTFERLRRTRHSAQYFDPSSAEISAEDSAWALSTARTVVEAVGRLLAADPPDLFE